MIVKDEIENVGTKDRKDSNKRIDYFDIAKGIGILIMIIGHMNLKQYPLIKNFIYSFHMPLFFIISGYFFKVKDNKTCIRNIFGRLIKPYIITCIIIIIIQVVKVISTHNIRINYVHYKNMGNSFAIWKWRP